MSEGGFFDDSHVMGLEGSAGPPVGTWDMVQQLWRQQFRVDSQRALDAELQSRWAESLQGLRAAGHNFNAPVNPLLYRGYARFVREGTPVTMPTVEGEGYGARINWDLQQPDTEFEEMRRANEAIRQLNNPQIRSFEQILEEVGEMQRGVEQETASMSERAGWFANLIGMSGSIAGSFTTRDPLNIVTAPFGAGRTIATRIGTDMLVAAGVVAATEFGDVAPNRALAGLPERDPFLNIAAAAVGAGIIRGGIEGIGYGVRRLREGFGTEEVDFNLRDSVLQQMFESRQESPTARAGAQALDDMIFIERNNPYGEGQAANVRFLAELQQWQRTMGGEPMTAVARVLPPLPFEYIQKAADFEIVREQAPLVYARMEAAQRQIDSLNATVEQRATLRDMPIPLLRPALKTSDGRVMIGSVGDTHGDVFAAHPHIKSWAEDGFATTDGQYLNRQEAAQWVAENDRAQVGSRFDDDEELNTENYKFVVEGEALASRQALGETLTALEIEQLNYYHSVLGEKITPLITDLRDRLRTANQEYQTAYRAVEAEAARLHKRQARVEAAQQRESVNIFADATYGRPFNWSVLQHDHVQARVDAINAFNDTLDEKAVAAFVREMEGEGEEAVAREAWLTEEGLVDIGLKQPVDPDFRITTDDGDISIADAMRDLQDDADLDEAMRSCLR